MTEHFMITAIHRQSNTTIRINGLISFKISVSIELRDRATDRISMTDHSFLFVCKFLKVIETQVSFSNYFHCAVYLVMFYTSCKTYFIDQHISIIHVIIKY